jgi:2,3-bisphosphoglycerate-independent phosphoglycerate mutase
MKGVFVIMDGVADEPCSALGDRTPLEAAKTPNLDEISKKSRIDHCFTVKEGVAPESSAAVVSLLGYDPNFAPRGPIEAKGMGLKTRNGDLAFRCNFATLDNLKDLNILDRRAGRTLTTEEARILAKAVNEKVKLPHGFKFQFYPAVQHRGVLVIKGGFSDNISNIDPAYGAGEAVQFGTEGKMPFAKPLDDEEDSKLSAEIVNSFVRQSFEVLEKHPVNIARAKKGLYPANVILCRDAGSKPTKFKKLAGRWMALGYMPLEIGASEAAGMEVYKFRYPKLKGIDVYGNLYDGLEDAIKYAKKMLSWNKNKQDYFYIHFKETDVPGHDNKPHDKVKMIEMIDKDFFSFLKDFIKDARLIVTADHTTACKKKAHTAEPVPVLIYPQEKESSKRFTEKEGLLGKKLAGRNLLKNNLLAK